MKRLLFAIYCLIYAFIYAGWLSHHSLEPVILRYSFGYFLFLVVMASVFFFPLVITISVKKIGWKRFWFSIIPSLTVICVIYLIFALHYYYTQEHLFDPFLQNPVDPPESLSLDKKDGTFRIMCLGGSTTKNIGLPPAKRYPSMLQAILKEHYPGVDIEVINAGTTWYTSKHSFISYATYWEDWNPDLIIIMHAINDLSRSFSPPDYAIGEYNDLWTHFYGASIRGAKPPTFEKYLLGYFEIPINAWYAGFRWKERDYPPEHYVSIEAFEKNMKKLVKYAAGGARDILLVTQPSLYKETMSDDAMKHLYFGKTIANTRLNFVQRAYPSPKSFYGAMRLFNEITKKLALKEDIAVVDAAELITGDLRNFRDDVHYTEEGARLLAGVIAEVIVKENFIGKAAN